MSGLPDHGILVSSNLFSTSLLYIIGMSTQEHELSPHTAEETTHVFTCIPLQLRWVIESDAPSGPNRYSTAPAGFDEETRRFSRRLQNMFQAEGCQCHIEEVVKKAVLAMRAGLDDILALIREHFSTNPFDPTKSSRNVTLEQLENLEILIACETVLTLTILGGDDSTTAHVKDGMSRDIERRIDKAKKLACKDIASKLPRHCPECQDTQ